MKQVTKQKWILSSLLIAALTSQYYFSINSKNFGSTELASEATEKSVAELVNIIDKAKEPTQVTVEDNKMTPLPAAQASVATPASGDQSKPKTEAVSSAVPCSDCVVLTKAEADRLRQILAEVAGNKAKMKPVADPNETPAERMRREREEREELRREEKLAKEEKAREEKLAKEEKKREAQELRDEKFRDDFDRLSSRCSDIECYSSAFATALNRYTSKDKRISQSVLNSVFKEYIEKDLKEGLKDPSNEKALSALQALMTDIPAEYKTFKNKSIDLARSVTAPMAVETNALFKQADQLRKANKINESTQIFSQAVEQKSELERTLQAQYSAIKDGTDASEDKATYNYYNLNYVKPASKWLADIMNVSNFSVDTQTSNGTTVSTGSVFNPNGQQQAQPTRGVVRGGSTSNPLMVNQPSQIMNQGQQSGTIQFGNTQTGTRGGRGSYQQ